MFVKKDAKVLWFCTRRCEKNMIVLKRNPRFQKWTEAARHAKRQHMAEMAHEEEDEPGIPEAKGTQAKETPAAKSKSKPARKKAAGGAKKSKGETK